jgi:hypothetical protein
LSAPVCAVGPTKVLLAALAAVLLAFGFTPGAASAERWRPAPGLGWQIQLQGRPDLSVRAAVYELDGFDVGADVVSRLHAAGRKAVCYVNAGAWEAWRPDAGRYPRHVIGAPLEGWPGERWLDIRRLDVLLPLIRARFRMCRTKGFDAVDPDNVSGYAGTTGFMLTAADQLRFNRALARTAHELGLSVALKNDLDQVRALVRYFEFAVVEECFQYEECERVLPFVRARKAVFAIEYRLPRSRFCAQARRLGIVAIRKRLDLRGWRLACP